MSTARIGVGPRLELRQGQSLVMTPQLQQAIKLLQLSNIELTEFVDQEIEQNPFLERTDGEERRTEQDIGLRDDSRRDADERLLDRVAGVTTGGETGEAPLDTPHGETWGEEGGDASAFSTWGTGGNSDFQGGEFGPDDTAAPPTTLREHLIEQLVVDVPDGVDRMIGVALIDSLDEAGYLTVTLDEIAERLGCAAARVSSVLSVVQQFDPAGAFARSLAECLALQLRERNRLDPAMQALLDNLDLLARRDAPALMRACAVDSEDLSEMVAEIRALNPKPGLAFDSFAAQTVVADVMVRAGPDGAWIIELNSDTLPRVLVNQRYLARLDPHSQARPTREFITERVQAANWLVKSLQQRAQTILKVAVEIVRQQDAFFRLGVQHLRPLVLRDVATAIEMHESTVSRVTTNKYMACPQGLFELKYFFNAAIGGSNGAESHASESVRQRIRMLVEAETRDEILSDDRIVEILQRDGVEIARRTVAKYREALGIASSIQRRREKSFTL
jgi:RNA polymerase sigma-54 factor